MIGFLDNIAIRQVEKGLRPFMRADERIIEYDVASVDGIGSKVPVLLSSHAIYFSRSRDEAIRIPYEDVMDLRSKGSGLIEVSTLSNAYAIRVIGRPKGDLYGTIASNLERIVKHQEKTAVPGGSDNASKARPRWYSVDTWRLKNQVIGIVVAAGILAALGFFANSLRSSSSSTSPPAPGTSSSTAALTTVASLTTAASGGPDRDPSSSDTFISDESSQEFFEGTVVVSIGKGGTDDSGYVLRSVVVRIGGDCWRFEEVHVGDSFRLKGQPDHEVQVRSLDIDSGRFVVLRHPQSTPGAFDPHGC